MGPGLEWVAAAYAGRPQITMNLRTARLPRDQQAGMPYGVVAFTERNDDMPALKFEPDTVGLSGTELIRPADPTTFLTAAAAGYTDRTDDITTANTLLRADFRNDDDAASLEEVRNRLQILADTEYDLRHGVPD